MYYFQAEIFSDSIEISLSYEPETNGGTSAGGGLATSTGDTGKLTLGIIQAKMANAEAFVDKEGERNTKG